MVQKYQNEIPPIFYYRISTKSSEKVLKIPNLQALTLGRIIKITLYIPHSFLELAYIYLVFFTPNTVTFVAGC